jgi:hypothetical protein
MSPVQAMYNNTYGSRPVVRWTLQTSPDSPAVELDGVAGPAIIAGDCDVPDAGVRVEDVAGRSS